MGQTQRERMAPFGASLPLEAAATNDEVCPIAAIRWSQIGCLRRVGDRHARRVGKPRLTR
jgi:hypothetical protein